MSRLARNAAILAAAILVSPSWTFAVFRSFSSIGGGNWSIAGNWSPAGVPNAADSADFPAQVAGGYVVNMPASASALDVGFRGITTLQGTNPGDTLSLADGLRLFCTFSNPQVTIDRLTVYAPTAVAVGVEVQGTSAQLTLANTSLFSTGVGAGEIQVGYLAAYFPGTCSLFANNSIVDANSLRIGPNSAATVSVTASTFNISGITDLAATGQSSTLSVAGATASYNTGSLSLHASGTGSATATFSNSSSTQISGPVSTSGANTQINVTNSATVNAGHADVSAGQLNISQGSTFDLNSGNSQFGTLGNTTTISITENSSLHAAPGLGMNFGMGRGATGDPSICNVTISAGAGTPSNITGGGPLTIGNGGGTGTVNVDGGFISNVAPGDGSIVVGTGRDFTGNVDHGASNGTLTIKNGSFASTRTVVTGSIGGKGAIDLQGVDTTLQCDLLAVGDLATFLVSTQSVFQSDGTLTVSNGARVVGLGGAAPAFGISIGYVGGKGAATVEGNGSTMRAGPNLNVGSGVASFGTNSLPGNGSLSIKSGGVVEAGALNVGTSGGIGTVTLTDAGSTLSVTGNIRLGDLAVGSSSGSSATLNMGLGTLVNAGSITTGVQDSNTVSINLAGSIVTTGRIDLAGVDNFNWTSGAIQLSGVGSDFYGRCNVPNGGSLYVAEASGLANGQAINNNGFAYFFGSNTLSRIDQTGFSESGTVGVFRAGTTLTTSRVRASSILLADNGVAIKLTGDSTIPSMSYASTITYVAGSKIDLGVSGISFDSGTVTDFTALLGTTLVSSGSDSQHNIGMCYGSQLAPGLMNAMNVGGVQVHPSSVVLRYTLKGDTNLDLAVDFSDLLKLAQRYNLTSIQYWSDGDSNYDGTVNFDDLLSLAQNYNLAVSVTGSFDSDWLLAKSMIPEPGALVFVAAATMSLRRRRA